MVLLAFHVDLVEDSIALPDPELAGARNLIHLHFFNPWNFTIPLQSTQDLRGRLNRWSIDSRLWRWFVGPINQMLGQTDTTLFRIRCGDREKWLAFWRVIQFLSEMETDEGQYCLLFQGVFSEFFGAQAEMSFPDANRRSIWAPGDATPSCFRRT